MFQIRQVELQFTVGEALSCAGAGMFSQAARDPWTIQHSTSPAHKVDPDVMKNLIETIVTKHSKNPIPYARQVRIVGAMCDKQKTRPNTALESQADQTRSLFTN